MVKDKSAPTEKQYRAYCFTYNNYEVDIVDKLYKDLMMEDPALLVWGEEVGDSGTPHLQGYIKFKNGKTFGKMKKLLPKCHIEAAKGTAKANFAYCTKDATNIRQHGFPPPLDDPMDGLALKGWQIMLNSVLDSKPDPRKILWFWEPNGNVGKTCFAKHLCLKRQALYICGSAADVKFGYASCGSKPSIVIYGVPRAETLIDYSALEQVKDGIFFTTKYESGMCLFNIPHVIVFANREPDYSKLSSDRWEIHCISEDGLSDDF